MNGVELHINGFFDVTFTDIESGEEVHEDTEKIILENLQSGAYFFGLGTKTVYNLEDSKPLYGVVLDATDALEYEWDER